MSTSTPRPEQRQGSTHKALRSGIAIGITLSVLIAAFLLLVGDSSQTRTEFFAHLSLANVIALIGMVTLGALRDAAAKR